MSINNPITALDRALGAEERANERVCALEDERDRLIVALKKAKPFVCEAASKMRPAKRIESATYALTLMYEWPEIFK